MNYEELVAKRKKFAVQYPGFFNQSTLQEFDNGDHLDPWAQWHNKIPAEVLLVGQDWGDKRYYIENEGRDSDNNFTCSNLIKLFDKAGKNIGKPSDPNKTLNIHFVNVIPFLRMENMQGNQFITREIISDSINEFLKPLIEMVNPKTIITLGKIPLMAVTSVYQLKGYKSKALGALVEKGPIKLNDKTTLFPMFHCGALGVNINRKMPLQEIDWVKLKDIIA